jgi:hypothetical protein
MKKLLAIGLLSCFAFATHAVPAHPFPQHCGKHQHPTKNGCVCNKNFHMQDGKCERS